jgi:septum site-determining protein MinC
MEALSVPRGGASKESIAAVTRDLASFELKGIMTPVTVLRLRSRDTNLVDRQLRAKVAQFPHFFRDSPVVLDFSALDGSADGMSLAGLAHVMRACKVVPIGVANLSPAHLDEAAAAGLAVLKLGGDKGSDSIAEAAPEAPAAAPKPAARPAPPIPTMPVASTHRPPLVVRQPVRSGQIIYAQHTDLIVLAPVNPGAQVVADGHIHCYALLRGRALAGAQGYAEARIFCQRIEAEMLSIAGTYLISDQVPQNRWGKPGQVVLTRGECVIEPL